MAYNSLTQTFSADFSLNDWPTQLALVRKYKKNFDLYYYWY